MHPQLAAIAAEFESAQDRLHRLAEAVPEARWSERPAPKRWSAAECVAHLNLTSEAFLPPLRSALQQGRDLGGAAPARYRRDVLGWFLWRIMGPPARLRSKTAAPFVPTSQRSRAELVREFDRLQAEQLECVRQAEGLPLGRVRVRSPFDARVSYNLYSCLTILPRHQHRHLWQAEQAVGPTGL
jgi:hypothetical protein